MDVINNSGLSEALLCGVASQAALLQRDVIFFLDNNANWLQRDEARMRVEANKRRGWEPYPWDLDTIQEDRDFHAWFCPADSLTHHAIPDYVKQSVSGHGSVIYLDATILKAHRVLIVINVAHECRHAWQYYKFPLVFYGANVLRFVLRSNLIPAEVDAEAFAKRVSMSILGREVVMEYVERQAVSGPSNQREMWRMFQAINHEQLYLVEDETRKSLLENGQKLRKFQQDCDVSIPHLAKTASFLRPADRERFLADARR